MAGAGGVDLAIAAINGGAVGSLPCAMLDPETAFAQACEVGDNGLDGPLNLNFFCHGLGAAPDEDAWRALLEPYYSEECVREACAPPLRRPFDHAMCKVVERYQPEVVSFHFGLPNLRFMTRVRITGAKIFGNATTVAEMRWLTTQGVDAVIVQGSEAGGHSGWFLDGHRPTPLAELLAEKIDVPVIAAGGIVDRDDMAAAFEAGASAVQIGTAYLACPESLISAPFRRLLGTEASADAAFTNLFSGREARGIRNRLMRELGTMRTEAPAYPYASNALAPLRAKAEADGRGDYSPLWAGTGAARVRAMGAEALTEMLAVEARALLERAA
jgi:nitronate monooxygenase